MSVNFTSENTIIKDKDVEYIKSDESVLTSSNYKGILEDKKEPYYPHINYFVKYWELWKENEIIVAKIKEKAHEIEIMNKHLENLQSK
jgi:hypothetical protein